MVANAGQARSIGKPLGDFVDVVEHLVDIDVGNGEPGEPSEVLGNDLAQFVGLHSGSVGHDRGRRCPTARDAKP